jgi:hypothetical protein
MRGLGLHPTRYAKTRKALQLRALPSIVLTYLYRSSHVGSRAYSHVLHASLGAGRLLMKSDRTRHTSISLRGVLERASQRRTPGSPAPMIMFMVSASMSWTRYPGLGHLPDDLISCRGEEGRYVKSYDDRWWNPCTQHSTARPTAAEFKS